MALNQLFWTLTKEKSLPFMTLFWEESKNIYNLKYLISNINFGKGRYTQYMWTNDMFILWNCIPAIFYEDREYCLEILPKQHAFVH